MFDLWLEEVPRIAGRQARLDALDRRLVGDPGDLPARVLAARLAGVLGDPTGARLRLAEAPDSLERDLLLAHLAQLAGRGDELVAHYRNALDRLDAADGGGLTRARAVELSHRLLDALHEEGELAHLRAAGRRLAELDEGDGECLRDAAAALSRAGLDDVAEGLLTEGLEQAPDDLERRARLLSLRGDVRAARDRGDGALEDWRAALELLAPDHWLRRDLERRELDLCTRGGRLEELEARRAAQASGTDARPAHFLALARVRGRRGDVEGALAALELGRARFPGEPALRDALWTELADTPRPELLREPLERALEAAADDPAALLDLARRCALRLPDLARDALARAEALRPGDPVVLQARYELERDSTPGLLGTSSAAELALERWIASDPRAPAERLELARALEGAGRPLAVLAQLRAVVAERPDDLDTRARLVGVLTTLADRGERETRRALDEGGDRPPGPLPVELRAEARGHLRALVDRARTHAVRDDAAERLASSFEDPDEARAWAEEERDRRRADPDDPAPLWVRAHLLMRLGEGTLAIVRAREYLALAPDDLTARARLARWLAAEGRTEEALDELSHLLATRGPERVQAGLEAADLYRELGRDDEALAALERLRPLVRRSPELLLELARRHRRLGRLDRAAEDARRALRLEPEFVEASRLLAGVAEEDRRPTEALRVLQDVWRHSDHPGPRREALHGMARVLGDRVEAELERLLLAARANPWDTDSSRLAMELALVTDHQQAARAAADRRLETDPSDLRALEVRARSALATDDVVRARADLLELLARRPPVARGGFEAQDDPLGDLRAGVVGALVERGQRDAALELTRTAPDPRPVARELMGRGHYRLAAEHLERWSEQHGIGGDAVLELASELERYMEDPEFAVRVYRARLDRDGEELGLLADLAGALARLDRDDEVRAVGRRILALDVEPERTKQYLQGLGLLDLWAEAQLDDGVADPTDADRVRAALAALRTSRHEVGRALVAVDQLLSQAHRADRRPARLRPDLGPCEELAWRLELAGQARAALLRNPVLRDERTALLQRILREDGDLSAADWAQLEWLLAREPGGADRPAVGQLERALADSGDPRLAYALVLRAREAGDRTQELSRLLALLERCERDPGLRQFQRLLELERVDARVRFLSSLRGSLSNLSREELELLTRETFDEPTGTPPLWFGALAFPERSELELRAVWLLHAAGRDAEARARLTAVERPDLRRRVGATVAAARCGYADLYAAYLAELRAGRAALDDPARSTQVPESCRAQQDQLLRAASAWWWFGPRSG